LIVAGVAVGAVGVFERYESDPEMAAKPAVTFLQLVDLKYRSDNSPAHMLFEKNRTYCAAGILGTDSQHRIWILLNSDLGAYISSSDNYRITDTDLAEMKRQCHLSDKALGELMAHKH
jgi:hypothetical protein